MKCKWKVIFLACLKLKTEGSIPFSDLEKNKMSLSQNSKHIAYEKEKLGQDKMEVKAIYCFQNKSQFCFHSTQVVNNF